MSRHEGVSCDSCLKSNFNGRRYKCLICYDYDLCADCYEEGATSTRHSTNHPMQCILTRNDIELFFGGEMLTTEQPQSYTCPYCKKMGFSDVTLLEHVSSEHTETSLEVVCPVCAGLPGGEPNLVTDDFAGHLTLEHRQGQRELISFLDEPSAIRHGGGVRRIPGRALGGPRSRRSNMHFSSSSGISALSPSGRESVDPIAELLSQLSGVRRGGPQSSQLQQLQMQIQLERQQVTATRQQLERLPRRAHPMVSSSNSNATMAEVISSSSGAPIIGGNSVNSNGVGTNNANGSSGGGGGSCRTNEWSLNTVATNQHPQSNLAANAINSREPGGFTFGGGSGQSNFTNALGIIYGGLSSSAAGGSGATGAQSAGQTNEGQSQFLLTKYMQPTLSDAEWAEIERERADRSQFVQALLLSTLSCSTLELEEEAQQHNKRDGSQESNSDNVNNESVSAANNQNDAGSGAADTVEQQQQKETLINNNAGAATDTEGLPQQQQQQFNVDNNGHTTRQQVHQQQQTSPEDFLVDEYKQQQQQQSYSSKKKQQQQQNTNANSNNSQQQQQQAAIGSANNAGNKPTADRGNEKRGRPPPAAAAPSVAVATSSQQQQPSQQQGSQSQQQQQKHKQSSTASATAAAGATAPTNQIPDTR